MQKFCKKALSTFMLSILAISLLILPVEPALSSSEVVIFSEDFEGVFPTDNDWEVGDLNADNGEDYWDDTDYKARSGSKSGWSAQIGDQVGRVRIFTEDFEDGFGDGINGWSVGDADPDGIVAYWDDVSSAFGGEGTFSGNKKGYCAGYGYGGSTASPTYQNYMDAYMSRTLDLTDFDDADLTFYYKMPSLDIEDTTVYDYGQFLVDGVELAKYDIIGTSWESSVIDLSIYVGDVIEIKWNFHSDSILVYEGWYIDDIRIFGRIPTPTSNSEYHNYDDYMDTYMMKQIDLSGYISANLSYYYWLDSEPDWDFLYVETSTDGSTWNTEKSYTGYSAGWKQDTVDLTPYAGSSVYIRFLFFSDGIISEYEGAYLDDIVIAAVDDIDPTVSITSPSTGAEVKSSSVTVSWNGSDVGAGIDHYEVRLDGGSWINKGMATTHTFTGVSDGSHTVEVRAVDKGGNSDMDSVSFTVNTSLFLGPGWMDDILIFVIIIVIIGAIVVVIVVVRRRRKPMPSPLPPPPLPPPPPLRVA